MDDLVTLVRDKTTDDQQWLPTEKITFYLNQFQGEWKLAAAECLIYMARDDIYETYQRGGIQVSKPLLRERANELRAEAIGGSGFTVTEGSLTRGDYTVDTETDPEYAINHPPYTYGDGLLRTVKRKVARGESPYS